MELMMYLDDRLVESMNLNSKRITEPSYVGKFVKELRQRHEKLIERASEEPEFLIFKLNSIELKLFSTHFLNKFLNLNALTKASVD